MTDLLQYFASKMEYDLKVWLKELEDERERVYELNYFTKPQILALRVELGLFNAGKDKIQPGVLTLLQSISKAVTSGRVREAFEWINSDTSASPSQDDHPTQVELESEECKNYLKPTITIETLNETQTAVMEEIHEEYSKKLILLAFEETNSTKIDDIVDWCDKHESDFNYLESEELTQQQNINETDGDMTLSDASTSVTLSLVASLKDKKSLMGDLDQGTSIESEPLLQPHLLNRIQTEKQIPIDATHPVVKELLQDNFDLSYCLEAAEIYRDLKEIESARNYTQKLENEESISKQEDEEIEMLLLVKL